MEPEIILVDDDPNDAELVRLAAQEIGGLPPIRWLASGEAALEALLGRRLSPLLILLDIKMPGMDGFETLRRLRADPIFRNVVVVILTGSDLEADRVEAMNLGCNLFLTKPATMSGYYDLIGRIKKLLP